MTDREKIRRKAQHVLGGGLDASLGKDCLDLLSELEQAERQNESMIRGRAVALEGRRQALIAHAYEKQVKHAVVSRLEQANRSISMCQSELVEAERERDECHETFKRNLRLATEDYRAQLAEFVKALKSITRHSFMDGSETDEQRAEHWFRETLRARKIASDALARWEEAQK